MSYSSHNKPKVRRFKLVVQVAGVFKQLTIFQWMSVSELKQEIYRLFGVPVQQQRLFNGHLELSSSRMLEDYHIFNQDKKNRIIVVEFRQLAGSFIRICPGSEVNSALSQLVAEIQHGLAIGLAPNLTMDGTGGTYFLKNTYKKIRAVFKPLDEEAFAPFNPRGHVGKFGSPGFRPGVLSGEAGYREVAAYLLDHQRFSGVPNTTLVECQHDNFYHGTDRNAEKNPKKGSLQEFIKSQGCIEDFSSSLFTKQEVQKIAILDIRILNMDRNEANILVQDNFHLVPIDHGLSIPDCLDISEYDLCWMSWPQVKSPIEPECYDYIETIDPVADISLLRDTMPFRDKCLRNIRVSSLLLKKGAEAGLSLFHIGSMLYREGYEDNPSIIENIIDKSRNMYYTLNEHLHTRLMIERSLSPRIKNNRQRAFSSGEESFLDTLARLSPKNQSSPQNTETDTSDNAYDVVMMISELSEEDEEDHENFPHLDSLGRSLSLPSLMDDHSIKKKVKKKRDEDEAFNQKLFYYIEAFMEQAIEMKVKDLRKNETPEGRIRSCSYALG
ncbi:unnamed protein product [Blepharisma stoltei]|uniref:1-phosphatidylinositol 4-kinase n=1 Tax=Blepharisma stoltei TaxID=1481888 RepID=A0AAU9K2S9_9CILI|nr:unnamed protein product [Blepharisma stoltei]